MAPSKISPELPLELLCEIIKLLPLTDLQTFSLVSRFTRSQAIHFIFGHLRYTDDIIRKVRNIYQARNDVKEVIKKLELKCSGYITEEFTFYDHFENGYYLEDEDCLVIFQFLETLPNLQVLYLGSYFPPASLPQFISSIRHTALLELVLWIGYGLEGPPTAGLAGLEKLSIRWRVFDSLNEPGSSLAHMYELIRPTLTTLVNLTLVVGLDILPWPGDFDLQLLKPAADTLRTFEYTIESNDESIFDAIPMILPHLTKLSISYRKLVLWKDAHIQALSKNKNLTDLTLSSNFEVNTQDIIFTRYNYVWDVRCYKRRLKATQDIASACPRLQRCSWQMLRGCKFFEKSHPFIVEERMTGGNVTRVVRGVKQEWMDKSPGKLKDLPGDIIGQNDV